MHAHTHGGPQGGNGSQVQRHIALAFALNTAFVVVEIVGGMWTDSIAILADALHDAMDSVSLGLAWYLARVGARAPDETFTYGYKRYTILSALITGILILVGQAYIISEAVPRFWNPVLPMAEGMLWLAILGIAVNGLGAWILSRGQSLQEKVLTWHLMEDVLGWVAVLGGAILIMQFGWALADPLLAVAIALYVIVQAWKHLRKVVPILMQSAPEGFDQDRLSAELNAIDGVIETHDLHAWSLDGEKLILSVHVVVDELMPEEDRMAIRHHIDTLANTQLPTHTTVEMETPSHQCPHREEPLQFGPE